MSIGPTRRRVLSTLGFAGIASLLHMTPSLATAERLETTTVRLGRKDSICIAPQYIAAELLRADGFTDVRYAEAELDQPDYSAFDFISQFASSMAIHVDNGAPLTILSGLHAGCFELFGNDKINSIVDLKGKRVGVPALGDSPQHAFLSVMTAYVGLDPVKDINWVTSRSPKPAELFAEGSVDAFLGFPPEPQELRARHVGRVVVNSAVDRPWSQYFCCMIAANRDYVRKYPVATKRVLRAILKAADLCATEPDRVTRQLVEGGFTERQDYARQAIGELPYDSWREYDPEDTMRFYALRLHEAGLVKASPNKIIADGTDWRFLNKLKHELKA